MSNSRNFVQPKCIIASFPYMICKARKSSNNDLFSQLKNIPSSIFPNVNLRIQPKSPSSILFFFDKRFSINTNKIIIIRVKNPDIWDSPYPLHQCESGAHLLGRFPHLTLHVQGRNQDISKKPYTAIHNEIGLKAYKKLSQRQNVLHLT